MATGMLRGRPQLFQPLGSAADVRSRPHRYLARAAASRGSRPGGRRLPARARQRQRLLRGGIQDHPARPTGALDLPARTHRSRRARQADPLQRRGHRRHRAQGRRGGAHGERAALQGTCRQRQRHRDDHGPRHAHHVRQPGDRAHPRLRAERDHRHPDQPIDTSRSAGHAEFDAGAQARGRRSDALRDGPAAQGRSALHRRGQLQAHARSARPAGRRSLHRPRHHRAPQRRGAPDAARSRAAASHQEHARRRAIHRHEHAGARQQRRGSARGDPRPPAGDRPGAGVRRFRQVGRRPAARARRRPARDLRGPRQDRRAARVRRRAVRADVRPRHPRAGDQCGEIRLAVGAARPRRHHLGGPVRTFRASARVLMGGTERTAGRGSDASRVRQPAHLGGAPRNAPHRLRQPGLRVHGGRAPVGRHARQQRSGNSG